MSTVLNCGQGTSTQFKENQVSASTTTQQNVFTVQQFQPQAIFPGAHIDKFERCTFNINVFCGISQRLQGWMRTDCWAIVAQTGINICCTFGHVLEIFHWACRKKNGYFVFIHWQSLYKAVLWTVIFVPFGLETSDRSKPAKCLSPRRDFLFGHIINGQYKMQTADWV